MTSGMYIRATGKSARHNNPTEYVPQGLRSNPNLSYHSYGYTAYDEPSGSRYKPPAAPPRGFEESLLHKPHEQSAPSRFSTHQQTTQQPVASSYPRDELETFAHPVSHVNPDFKPHSLTSPVEFPPKAVRSEKYTTAWERQVVRKHGTDPIVDRVCCTHQPEAISLGIYMTQWCT